MKDPYEVIIAPIVTESAFMLMDQYNQMVFLVQRHATKRQIKEAVERLFDVKVAKVNTVITPKGNKKAFVRLTDEYSALDVATIFGIM